MSKYFYFVSFACLTLIVSCKKDDPKVTAQKIVSEWMGKTIMIPNDISSLYMSTDTIIETKKTPYKILVYTDSTGCVSCKLRLSTWKYYMHEIDSILPGQVDFQFYFQPKNFKEIAHLLKLNNFTHPIYIDQPGKINKLNRFPSEMEYQCFLLDNQNTVLSIGNPTLNPKIWDLYKQIITKSKDERKLSMASVEIEQREIEMKNLKVGKISTITFVFKSIGNKPLLISHVDASCGCTLPYWDVKPIQPEEKTEIRIEIKPDNPGYFNKVVYAYTNTDEKVIPLNIKGMVE